MPAQLQVFLSGECTSRSCFVPASGALLLHPSFPSPPHDCLQTERSHNKHKCIMELQKLSRSQTSESRTRNQNHDCSLSLPFSLFKCWSCASHSLQLFGMCIGCIGFTTVLPFLPFISEPKLYLCFIIPRSAILINYCSKCK